jgi:hypothetical protein
MTLFQHDMPADLLIARTGPCLSLYLTTHRSRASGNDDVMGYRRLLEDLRASLALHAPLPEVDRALEPFEALGADAAFWKHSLEGLAVFGAPGFFRVLRLQQPVSAGILVNDRFFMQPLWRLLRSPSRYQVLCLRPNSLRFFEGTRDSIVEVQLPDAVPGSPIGTVEWARPSWQDRRPARLPHDGGYRPPPSPRHGEAEHDRLDAESYFRAVDRAVYEQCSKPSGLPLIVAAHPDVVRLFHAISTNPFLVSGGILTRADVVDATTLQQLAWRAIRPKLEQPLRPHIDGQGPALTPDELSVSLAVPVGSSFTATATEPTARAQGLPHGVRTFVLDDGNGCKPDPDGHGSEGAST